MQLHELFLTEAIEQTLYADAFHALRKALPQWVHDNYEVFIQSMGGSVASLRMQAKDADKAYYQDDYDAKAVDRASAIRDKFYEACCKARDSANFRSSFEHDFRDQVERALQDCARRHIESRLGEIVPYDHSVDGGQLSELDKNLYWLTHIAVHLKTDGVNAKTGQKKTGGGYFSHYPKNSEFSGSATVRALDKFTEMYQGIVIYISADQIWNAFSEMFTARMQEDLFGESMVEGSPLEKFLRLILPTFVHEVIHMEQYSRKRLAVNARQRVGPNAKNPWNRSAGITYVPTPGQGRPKVQMWVGRGNNPKDPNDNYLRFRAGKKGTPDFMGDDDWDNLLRVTNYYATSHEIEAHAAATAAELLSNHIEHATVRGSRYDTDPISQQRDLNETVRELVQKIADGYKSYEGRLGQYRAYMRDNIPDRPAIQNDPVTGKASMVKADIEHRKVWRLFITKLIKHLMAYVKPVSASEEQREYYDLSQEPTTSKAGKLTYPTANRTKADWSRQ
jgi:hypothetical protein